MLPVFCIPLEKNKTSYCIFRKTAGPVDVGPEYEKELNDQTEKLVRLYGGGDMTKFPEFKFEGKILEMCPLQVVLDLQLFV